MLNTNIVNLEADGEGGVLLTINVDKAYNERVTVETVSMYVGLEDDGDGYYGDGDLAVNYDISKLQNDESARTAGMLLLRNIHSNDEVTAVMGEFYWEHAYDEELRDILLSAGFSAEAVADVCTSEWGMQDEGRASYDAYAIADEVRKHVAETIVA